MDLNSVFGEISSNASKLESGGGRPKEERRKTADHLQQRTQRSEKLKPSTSSTNKENIHTSSAYDFPSRSNININKINYNTENDNRISESLKGERLKALELLRKAQQRDITCRSAGGALNKENLKSTPNIAPSRLDHTDNVQFRRPNAVNISELVANESHNLETSSLCKGSTLKDSKISFEPAEMTGRSTHISQLKLRSTTISSSSRLSVSEILATSFAPKARNLCETLNSGNITTTSGTESSAVPISRTTCSSVFSSTMNSFNGTRSLPRTADLSKISHHDTSSFNAGGTFSFIDNYKGGEGNDAFDEEVFTPCELMQSKLLIDEINWAEEYAAIPEIVLSKQAKAKLEADKIQPNEFESSTLSNTNILNPSDPNFSIGKFFNMRSENILNIVNVPSPKKSRRPIALLEEADSTATTTNSESPKDVLTTPKCDNKNFANFGGSNTVTIKRNKTKHQETNDISNTYTLTLSAIERALGNMDIQTVDTDREFAKRLERYTSKQYKSPYKKIYQNQRSRTPSPSSVRNAALNADTQLDIHSIGELISENKENLDPQATLADTLSFTESLLDMSNDSKSKAVRNTSQQRVPLSPIELNSAQTAAPKLPLPQIIVNDESDNDADIDEFVLTPNKAAKRSVHLKKSPRHSNMIVSPSPPPAASSLKSPSTSPSTQKSVNENKESVRSSNTSTSNTNKMQEQQDKHRSPTLSSVLQSQPKSLCSTRLDGARALGAECDFAISPNLSKSSSSVLMSNGTRCDSCPAGFNNASPISSPLSCGISSQTSSPCMTTTGGGGGYRSPHLEVTTNTNRRFGEVTKAISSSVTSENGTSVRKRGGGDTVYGVPPMRTCSCNSTKSTAAASIVRSTSRCSNSSEFSHRDGKLIPLKVTAMELFWGSSKLRTDSRKSMQVKNTANKRLVVRIEIQGPGFQIVNDHNNVISLQSQECRSIVVQFCPTVIGVAVGTLSFYSPNGTTTASNNNAPFLIIPLYGYGGNSAILPRNLLKGPVGAAFLPIGDVCELANPPLQCVVNIHNRGPLLGFAILCIDSIGLHLPRLCDAFEIQPDRTLIQPGVTTTMRLIFRPKREEIRKIMKKITNVLTLVNLRIICGDEANRQRMRRLVTRLPADELAKISYSNTLEKLWSKFEGEREMSELKILRERPENTFDLLTGMRIYEVAITLNNVAALDETTETPSIVFPDGDETALFRTVCVYSPEPQQQLEPVDELMEASMTSYDGVSSSTRDVAWSVEPKQIEFDFNVARRNEKISLLVRNSYKTRQYFEVVCNYKDLLRFTPSKGYVEAERGQIEVEVDSVHRAPPERLPTDPIMIMVYLENERIMVPVKVPKDNYRLRE